MKMKMNIIIVLFCMLTIGCQENLEESPDRHKINSQLVHSYNDIALENAIISQHILYPYHFVQNGAELNELGKRDLSVLISHFTHQAGHLNIRRYNIPADLYEARIEYIQQKLQDAGIKIDRISISDDMPGGSGIASESILVILSEEDNLTTTEK